MPTLDRFATGSLDLVDAYEPGRSAVFAAPDRTLLAVGNRFPAGQVDVAELGVRVRDLLAETGAEAALSAIPFDRHGSAAVVLPDELRLGPGLSPGRPPADLHRVGTNGYHWQMERRPTQAAYAAGVVEALRRIEAGDAAKIVLARSLELTGGGRADAGAILRRLVAHDAGKYTYAMGLPPSDGRARHLVGASPELLVSRFGRHVLSRPVAGSAERSADPVEDLARGAALLVSAKDLAEHAFVVDAVHDALAPYCSNVTTAAAPSLTTTATMWHLQTEVVGELDDPSVSSLDLALALHPTPAVCGTPTEPARDAILELEGFQRGYYAGAVGWCDRAGDGEWVVAIRCAEVHDDSVRLYAGAGIVAGSEPAAEVAETSAKFRTMLEAMGLRDIA